MEGKYSTFVSRLVDNHAWTVWFFSPFVFGSAHRAVGRWVSAGSNFVTLISALESNNKKVQVQNLPPTARSSEKETILGLLKVDNFQKVLFDYHFIKRKFFLHKSTAVKKKNL